MTAEVIRARDCDRISVQQALVVIRMVAAEFSRKCNAVFGRIPIDTLRLFIDRSGSRVKSMGKFLSISKFVASHHPIQNRALIPTLAPRIALPEGTGLFFHLPRGEGAMVRARCRQLRNTQ